MPRLVTKFKYLKPGGGGKSVGGYARYIATREGVEKLDDTHRHAPTTTKQQALIEKILRDFPESKGSPEYEDFLREKNVGNASEFISMAIEENLDALANTKTYADYIATRPRVERFGSHGLFTDEGVEVQLSKVSQELNAYTGNVYTAILSLKREDAARLGFDNGSRWRDFLRGQTQTLSANLKIPMDHLRWYAAFHNEGHHPHIHLIAYSTVPGEGHLSKHGMENMRSAFVREIFSQELLFTYQQQTEYRDQLREQGRESISEIVARINAGTYRNPRIEELLLQLADRLYRTTGKKVYGYLKPDVKAIVDQIAAELAGDESIRKLYDLWYEQREDVLRTYTDTFPDRVPLEQNKEFKSIRNAVIQEALTITPQAWRQTNAGQRLRTEEEQSNGESVFSPPYPLRQYEKSDDNGDSSAVFEEQRPVATEDMPETMGNPAPVYASNVARSVSTLMAQMLRLFQGQDQRRDQNQRQQIDRKQRREISEKKQAMGIRD